MSRRAAALLAPLVASALLGCAATRPLLASGDDYQAYRETRVAPSLGERLEASHRYLDAYPEGDFAKDVRAFVEQAEPLFYGSKQDSVAGLEDYLRRLPRGPHAEEASRRLDVLRVTRARPEELAGVAAETEARLSGAARERAAVLEEVALWVQRFSRAEVLERPLAEAPRDVIVGWTLSLPRPICEPVEGATFERARRCRKILELPYTLPVAGQPDAREATVEVVVVEDAQGRPRDVTLAGPDFFVRLEEARSIRSIAADDAKGRAKAAEGAAALVEEKAAPGVTDRLSCKGKPAAEGAGIEVTCGGVRVLVRPGKSGAEDDRIVIEQVR